MLEVYKDGVQVIKKNVVNPTLTTIDTEYLSFCLIQYLANNNQVHIEKEDFELMLSNLNTQKTRVNRIIMINVGSIVITSVLIFVLLFYILKQLLWVSLGISLLYFVVDSVLFYRNSPRKLTRSLIAAYSKGVSAPLLSKYTVLLEVLS